MKIAGTELANARVGSGAINTIRIGSQLVWERSGTAPTATFAPETYGAVGDGVTDDTAAFSAMRTAILAAQTAQPGLRVTMNFAASAQYIYTSNKWAWGIRYLTIEGNGASVKNIVNDPSNSEKITWWTNSGVVHNNQDVPRGYLIDTATVGSYSVSLKDPSAASNFVVGRWIIVASYSQQPGGWPPNARYFDYAKVTSINAGVITLDRPLVHKHRDNWPSRGSSDEIDAARIIPAERDTAWAEHWIVRNLSFLQNPNHASGDAIQAEGFYLLEFENVNIPDWFVGQGSECVVRNSVIGTMEVDKLLTKLRIEGGSADFRNASGVDVIEMVNCDSVGILFFGRRLYINGCRFSGATIAGPPVQWWDPLSVGGFAPVEYVEVSNTIFDSDGNPSWPALKGTYNIERAINSPGFTLSGSDILIDNNYSAAWDYNGLMNRIYEGQRLLLVTSGRIRKGHGDILSIESNGATLTARIGVQWSVTPAAGDIVIQYGVMRVIGMNSPLIDTYVTGATPNQGIAFTEWNGELVKDVWTVTPP